MQVGEGSVTPLPCNEVGVKLLGVGRMPWLARRGFVLVGDSHGREGSGGEAKCECAVVERGM